MNIQVTNRNVNLFGKGYDEFVVEGITDQPIGFSVVEAEELVFQLNAALQDYYLSTDNFTKYK